MYNRVLLYQPFFVTDEKKLPCLLTEPWWVMSGQGKKGAATALFVCPYSIISLYSDLLYMICILNTECSTIKLWK